MILLIKLIKLIGRKDLNKGPLLNLTDGGDGSSGWIMSEEVKQKNKDRNTGEKNPMFGKNHSKETREKISKKVSGENAYFYGKKLSKEHRKKIGFPKIGKRHLKETRKKISESKKGKNLGIKRIEHSIRMTGINNPIYGKKRSKETRNKISYKLKEKMAGFKNPLFKYFYSFVNPKNVAYKNISELSKFCLEHNLKFNTIRKNKNFETLNI